MQAGKQRDTARTLAGAVLAMYELVNIFHSVIVAR